MLTGHKRVIIADIESRTANASGDRKKYVTSAKVLVCLIDLVGVNTSQIGQLQGFTLSYSVEVPRIQYENEKYLYFDGEVYEIKTLSKAKLPTNMLLNVQKIGDKETKIAIEEWIHENL